MRSTDLSDLQLQIAMHLANGMTFAEIATTVDRSTANVKKHANAARRKTNSKTLPQLVSVAIARGWLEWEDDQRVTRYRDEQANGDTASAAAGST